MVGVWAANGLPPEMARWPVDEQGRALMDCPDRNTVGHEAGHWWAANLRDPHPARGLRFLYCPHRTWSPIAVGQSR